MTRKRYRYTGRPDRPVPFTELVDRRVGEEFEAEFDKDTENYLVGGGAIAVVGRAASSSEAKDEPKAATADKPKDEPKSEPKTTPKEEPRATSQAQAGSGSGSGGAKPAGKPASGKPGGKS